MDDIAFYCILLYPSNVLMNIYEKVYGWYISWTFGKFNVGDVGFVEDDSETIYVYVIL